MTTSKPPKFFSDIFNSYYYQDEDTTGFTQDQADLRYLRKTTSDTSSGLITFSAGLSSNSIEPLNATDTLNINTVSSTATNIINIGNNTTNEQTLNLNSKTINVGDTSVPSVVNVISPSIFTGTATIATIAATTINSSAVNALINIGGNQVNAGATLNIGNNSSRVGPINIGTGLTTGLSQTINVGSASITSGTQTINLGGSQTISGGGSQTINLNKPLTLNYNVNIPNNMNILGSSQLDDSISTAITSGQILTLLTITTLPVGIYMVYYAITHSSASSLSYNSTRHGLTRDSNTFSIIQSNIYTAQVSSKNHNPTIPLVDNNCGILQVSSTAGAVRLTVSYDFSGGSLNLTSIARVVRIG
jgi:hypothetical protein